MGFMNFSRSIAVVGLIVISYATWLIREISLTMQLESEKGLVVFCYLI